MKTSVNFTTCDDDVARFADQADFERFLKGFDGVELMVLDNDAQTLIEPRHVVGVHMSSLYTWIDLWQGNEAGLLHEFGSIEAAEAYYGGLTRAYIVDKFKADLANAHRYDAAYVVFHASDVWSDESFTLRFHRSDEEVCEALCELLSAVFADESGDMALFMENLWHPGLNFVRPEVARDLLAGVDYANKGFMFDTGHAFHTNWDIETEEQGIAYVHGMLDGLERFDLLDAIRGVHLQQSITGEYARRTMVNPPVLSYDPTERMIQDFTHAFTIEQHKPFTCSAVRGLVEHLNPDYLTFEFITESREQLEEAIATQRRALRW